MDFFRSAAAIIVVVSHARDLVVADYIGNLVYAPFYAVTSFGHSGVVIFFVLSGFWITRSVVGRLDNRNFWRDYAIDRLSRLMIVLLPALALGGLLDWIGAAWLHLPVYGGQSGSHSVVAPVLDQLTPSVLLGNIAFLQTIVVPTWGSNGPLWSLAYEFWFYVWFPALALLVARRRFSLALFSLMVALFNPAIALGFLSWLTGFALLKSQEHLPQTPAPRWHVILAALQFAVILLIWSQLKTAALGFGLAVSFAGFLYVLRASQIALPNTLGWAARYGRDSSYSLYIVHFPLLALGGSLLSRGVRLSASPGSVVLVLALTIIAIAAGWAFSRFTEAKTGILRSALRRRFS